MVSPTEQVNGLVPEASDFVSASRFNSFQSSSCSGLLALVTVAGSGKVKETTEGRHAGSSRQGLVPILLQPLSLLVAQRSCGQGPN